MRSYGKGSLSATTQVKVLSPEILPFALGQGFHFLEANISVHAIGECASGVPGSKAVAGKRIVCIGTWENRIAPRLSRSGAEEVTMWYGFPVVGLTRSRGVGRVMPVASMCVRALEGVSSYAQGVNA